MSAPEITRAAPRGRPFLWLTAVAAVAVAWAFLRSPPPRNVLVVTIDTLRADALVLEDAPAMVEAAARGVRFLRARTPAPLTLPAHATLFTGLLPPAHGIRDNTAAPLPDGAELLAEEFRAAGYATAAFVASGVLDRRYGLDQGFDRYFQPPAPAPGAPSFHELEAKDQVARVREWMKTRPANKPFFLWVHLWDPHAPYWLYDGDARRAGTARGDPAPLLYKGEVRRADAAIEELLALVDPETTIVVLTSDHGESLGEHGEATHGYLCHGATMDVPLIVLGPDVRPGTVERVAGLEDVAPTLRRMCRLPARAGDGFDLFSLPEERVAVGESLAAHRLCRWAQQSVAFDGRFALLDGGARLELYDRSSDPGEDAPLAGARGLPAFERLDRALHAYRDRRGPKGRGEEVPAAPLIYGIPLIPEGDFLPVAENRALKDVRDALPAIAVLNRANEAIASKSPELVRAALEPLLAMEREDGGNPAPCLARGRALLLVLKDAPGAVAAIEEAIRRGYDGRDVDRLLLEAARAARDGAAEARATERLAAREKPGR